MSSRVLLKNILAHDAFFMVNKELIKQFGLDEAALLSVLVDREEYAYVNHILKGEFFQCPLHYIEEKLNLGRRPIEDAAKKLRSAGLIDCKLFGCPAIKYYSINHEAVINIISIDDSQFVQNEQTCLYETSKLDCTKGTIYKNNIDKNNNIKNNPLYANASPKGDEVKRSRVDYKLEEYPIEWHVALQEWIDYKKKERKDKLTPIGLRRFYNLANETCEGNIEWVRYSIQHTANHGWMGFQPLSKKEYDDKRTSGAIPETSVPADRDTFAF